MHSFVHGEYMHVHIAAWRISLDFLCGYSQYVVGAAPRTLRQLGVFDVWDYSFLLACAS